MQCQELHFNPPEIVNQGTLSAVNFTQAIQRGRAFFDKVSFFLDQLPPLSVEPIMLLFQFSYGRACLLRLAWLLAPRFKFLF